MDFKTEVVPALLGANLSVFSHTFGTKKVNITTLQRRKKILKSCARKLRSPGSGAASPKLKYIQGPVHDLC